MDARSKRLELWMVKKRRSSGWMPTTPVAVASSKPEPVNSNKTAVEVVAVAEVAEAVVEVVEVAVVAETRHLPYASWIAKVA